jgi:hypothetical protein
MATTVQDIQVVRGLRMTVGREVKLPTNILNSIEIVHNCIKSGTDLNGWKKVDWRDTSRGPTGGTNPTKSATQAYRSSSNSGSNSNSGTSSNTGSGSGSGSVSYSVRNGNSFFNNRQSSERREQAQMKNSNGNSGSSGTSSNSGHYAFNNRSKGGFRESHVSEPPVSIPLTNTITMPLPDVDQPLGVTPLVTAVTVTATPLAHDGFRTVHPKYVSKFKKNSDKVEDTILNKIILGKLNKFSELNYDEIKEFITHIIDSGQTDMIKCFMKLVFEKAASEEIFCPLYAKLLSELSLRYPVLLSEMANLYSVYMAIFEEVVDTKAENYNEVCLRNVEKKYRRGYSQFLAELIKYSVIDTDIFMKTVTKIITQIENNIKIVEAIKINEEYGDCLMKIMKAIQEDSYGGDDIDLTKRNMIETIRQSLKVDIINRIQHLSVRNTEYKGISNKARFTFLDVYESILKF